MRLRTSLLALLLVLPSAFACAADTGPGGYVGVADGARLEIIGGATRLVDEYGEETLEIRYVTAEGAPIGGIVEFYLEGETAGGSLSGHAARTNDEGVANVVVRAGQQARFDIIATAELARDPARVTVEVQPMTFGDLEYVVTYTGLRVVNSAEVALFTNVTCEEMNRAVPAPRAVQYSFLRARETFENVEVGVPMAVYALGIDRNDNVAAEACADVTLSGPTGTVEIPLGDISELFGGTYTVAETFDVTSGFNPSLDFTLDLLSGLATDPATWIVDYVADRDGTPGWLASALRSSTTRRLASDALRRAIDEIHVPGYVSDVFDLGHGIDTAFSELTLDGELTFGEGTEFGTYDGTHLVTGVRFPLTDGTVATRNVRALANLTVEVGPSITMHEHTLALPFGRIVEMVLNDVLFPSLPGSPANSHEFISDLFDCGAIATSIAGDSSTTEAIVNAVCDLGVTLIADRLESYITEMWQYDSLTLSGTAVLTDLDGDYDRDHLENGVADALWTGASGTLDFDGTLTGERLDDEGGRNHPVRDRFTGLR